MHDTKLARIELEWMNEYTTKKRVILIWQLDKITTFWSCWSAKRKCVTMAQVAEAEADADADADAEAADRSVVNDINPTSLTETLDRGYNTIQQTNKLFCLSLNALNAIVDTIQYKK